MEHLKDTKSGAQCEKKIRPKEKKPMQIGRWLGVTVVVVVAFCGFGMLADEGNDATMTYFLMQKVSGAVTMAAAFVIGRAMMVRGYWPDMED